MANNYPKLKNELLNSPNSRSKHLELRDELIEVSKLIRVIDQAREQRGLTKKQLAELSGIEPANIRRLLTAKPKNLSLATLVRLSKVLELQIKLQPTNKNFER